VWRPIFEGFNQTQEKAAATLDLEGPRSGHGAAPGLGMGATGQKDTEANGRAPDALGGAAVLHRHMGTLTNGVSLLQTI
jgi:hypothetical protein